MIGQFFGIFLGEQQNILQKIYKKSISIVPLFRNKRLMSNFKCSREMLQNKAKFEAFL